MSKTLLYLGSVTFCNVSWVCAYLQIAVVHKHLFYAESAEVLLGVTFAVWTL